MRRVRALGGVACLVGTLLLGCGGPSPGPGAAEPTRASGSSSADRTPTAADGPVVENDHASYRVPSGYQVADELAGTIPANEAGPGRGAITLAEVPAFGTTDLTMSAQVVASNVGLDRPPRRLDDVTLDGEPAFHLEGPLGQAGWFAAFGAVRQDAVVYVRFDLETPRAQSREVIESVLETWQWK